MKLVIFDLDGTLIDTLDDLANSCNHALKTNNFQTHPIESYKLYVGNGVEKLVERSLPDECRTAQTIRKVKNDFLIHYKRHSKDTTKPYAGTIELLKILKQENLLISVASNKYHEAVVNLVPHYFPGIKFDLILGHRDNHPAKPDPDIVIDTLKTLGVAKSNCYYVGDSSVDMLTAKNADVTAIGATWGFRTEKELREHRADHIVHNPIDILKIIFSKN